MNEQETDIIKAVQTLQENMDAIKGYLSIRGYSWVPLQESLERLHDCWRQHHYAELEMDEPNERETDSFLDAYTKD